MKKMKSALLLLLALCMVLSITACGSAEKNQTEITPNNSSDISNDYESYDNDKELSSNQSSSQISTNPISLSDAKRPSDSDFIYYQNYGYIELEGYQGSDEVVLLPNTIKGQPVKCSYLEIAKGAPVRGIVFEEGYTNIPKIRSESDSPTLIEAIGLPASCEELSDTNPFHDMPLLNTIEIADGNSVYYMEDDILHCQSEYENYSRLVCFLSTWNGDTYVQPDETRIAKNALENNSSIKRIENMFPWDGLAADALTHSAVEKIVCASDWTYLNSHAFEDNSGTSKLRSITLSANLNGHSGSAKIFEGLDCLEEIIMPEGNPTYFSEDGVLYFTQDSTGITYLMAYPNNHPAEEFTISERADSIYYLEYAFDNPLNMKIFHSADIDMGWYELPNDIEIVTP